MKPNREEIKRRILDYSVKNIDRYVPSTLGEHYKWLKSGKQKELWLDIAVDFIIENYET